MRRVFVLGMLAVVSGCSQADRPDYFASGRDARVYNMQTGRYEWPDGEPKRTPYKPRVNPNEPEKPRAGILGTGDERVFNPQSGRYEFQPQ